MDHLLKLRPFYVAKILYDRTDEDHSLTLAQIMQILKEEYGIDAHRQTVPDDIEALREFGFDIQEEMHAQKHYNLIGRDFDIPELKLLIDAVESSRFITSKKSKALVEKLASLAGEIGARSLKRNIAVEDRAKKDNEKIYLIIDAINDAINKGYKISFEYFHYNEKRQKVPAREGRPYVFSPYRLVWNGEYYYVVGYFDEKKSVSTFRLDRMLQKPQILPEKASPMPRGFSLSKLLNASFRMYYSAENEEVELICENEMMDAIVDRFGRDFRLTPVDDTHFRAKAEVSLGSGFYGWIFGFDGKVRIAGPKKVVKAYHERIQKAWEEMR